MATPGMCPKMARFPVAAGSVRLPANTTEVSPTDADFQYAMAAEAGMAWPRTVTLMSDRGGPFDAEIRWTAGAQGASGRIVCTAMGGVVLLCITATTLRIRAANWIDGVQIVTIGIESDATAPPAQHNVKRDLNLASSAQRDYTVPAFARSLRFAAADPTKVNSVKVILLDSAGTTMATHNADEGDISVGAASTIRIRNDHATALASYTLDFTLGL